MMDVAISTCILHSEDNPRCLANGLRLLAEAGWRRLDFTTNYFDIDDASGTIDGTGLSIWAVHGMLGVGCVSPDERERRAAVEDETHRMERFAEYVPCPYVIHWHDRHNDPAYGERFRKSVGELLKAAESLGINLAVETNPYKPEVAQRYVDSREVADFVRSFGSNHISVCVDVNHINLHEDPEKAIANCAGLTSHVHFSDNHGVREEHLLPGLGIIDFPRAWRALRRAGYEGPLSLECNSPEYPSLDELLSLREWAEGVAAVR